MVGACICDNAGVLHELDSFHWFLVATMLCFSYLPCLSARNDTSLTSRVYGLAMLNCVVLTVGASFLTPCFSAVPRYGSARTQQTSDRTDMTGRSGLRC